MAVDNAIGERVVSVGAIFLWAFHWGSMNCFLTSGCDQHVFAQTLILAESYRRVCGGPLQVCDFGMTPAQVMLLSQCADVIPRPDELAGDMHPWKLKSAISRYASSTGAKYDAIAWIDCDVVVLPDFGNKFEELVTRQKQDGAVIAAAPGANGLSLDAFCSRLEDAAQDLSYFRAQLAARGIAGSNAYLNSGFFVCLDMEVLEEWRQLSWQSTDTSLFEQNAFNVVAHATGTLSQISRAVWNANGQDLGTAVPTPAVPGAFNVHGQRSYAVHATSEALQQHELRVVNWSMEGAAYSANLKLFRNPPLRDLQIGYFLSLVEKTETPLLSPFLER